MVVSILPEQKIDQDLFEDAQDEIFQEQENSGDTLKRSTDINLDCNETLKRPFPGQLEECKVLLRMALNNEFVDALSRAEQRADQELYSSLAAAFLSFLRAALTLEQNDLETAVESINRSYELSNARRRKSSAASMMMRFIYRPNYDTYSDEEVHAELVHAESILLLTLVSFMSEQSILCLVRGAIRIRTCYQRYKECLFIMENRKQWDNHETSRHFESGVRLGHGVFNLLMSYLPRRVLRFLEYVGFSGNRSVAVDELDKSIELDDGLRSVFSGLVVLTYQSYIDNLFGLGSYDAVKVEQLDKRFLSQYPNSAFFLLFRGRYHQMLGRLDEAIESFHLCIEAQSDWKQFHSICHWEIMWCHAVRMDWKEAAKYSNLLRHQSKWSPASYNYQYASFLYSSLVDDERANRCPVGSTEYQTRMQEIKQIMEQVPSLRIRYAGKTVPVEKFSLVRSAKFLKQNNRLSLPIVEFFNLLNVFNTLKNNPKLAVKLLERIEEEIVHIDKQLANLPPRLSDIQSGSVDVEGSLRSTDDEDDANKQVDHWHDDRCLMLFLRGICLKLLGRFEEAESSFMEVIENEHKIVVDTHIVPLTATEMALLKIAAKDYDDARHYVKMARNNYTGYLIETLNHFKLHAATRIIRIETQEQSLTNSSNSSDDCLDQYHDDLKDRQTIQPAVPN